MVLSLPKAESCQTRAVSGYSDSYTSLYPYNNENLAEVIQKYAIKVPFEKLVDRTMGISTCTQCDSKYAGYQEKCTHFGYFYSVYSDNYAKFEDARKRSSYYTKVEEGWKECRSQCEWDLSREFSKQSSFFNMVSIVSSIPSGEQISTLISYKDCFLPGVCESLVTQKALDDIRQIQFQMDRHRQVIQEMINRMQAAGNALSCGQL